jgi:hypothetical protein
MKSYKPQFPDLAERPQLQLQEVTSTARPHAAKAAEAERRLLALRRRLLEQLIGDIGRESNATLH